MSHVLLPREILPADGRFGCGPSKIAPAHLEALAGPGSALLGTSHRQAPVKNLVGQVRAELNQLVRLPNGYEVTYTWPLATTATRRASGETETALIPLRPESTSAYVPSVALTA